MTTVPNDAQPAMEKLLDYDEEQLYQQLAMRDEVVKRDPKKGESFDLEVTAGDTAMMGLRDDLKELGQALFKRWSNEAYDLICGAGTQDDADRKKVADALGLNKMVAGAALAGVLVSSLGVAPALAAVIAAIAISRFFKPGYEEFCKVWKKHLP